MNRGVMMLSITGALSLVAGIAWKALPSRGRTVAVERGTLARPITAPGVLESESGRIALSFEISGRITEILVHEGDKVDADQLLAKLDDRIALARVARAEAAFDSASARRDLALKGSRGDEIKEASAALEAAMATARERKTSYERTDHLYRSQALAKAALDDAKSAADSATAHVDAAQARLALVRKGARSEVRREAIASAAAAQAELQEARTILSQTEIRAPRRGIIVRRLAEPGEQVNAMVPKTVLVMTDLDRLQLRVEIDESDVGSLAVGQEGYATALAYEGQRFHGKITRVQSELGRKTLGTDDPRALTDTRVLEVIFLPDDVGTCPIGLRMDAHFDAVVKKDALILPVSAIRWHDRVAYVVLETGREELSVQLGAKTATQFEVVSGLREGQRVEIAGD
jgi:multidrug resistance efflux pump